MNADPGSAAGLVFSPDGPPVRFHKPLCNGEAQTDPTGAGIGKPVKLLKEPVLLFRWKTRTGISNRKAQHP